MGQVRTFLPCLRLGSPEANPEMRILHKGIFKKYSQEKPIREWGTKKGKIDCQAESHRVEFQLQADPA